MSPFTKIQQACDDELQKFVHSVLRLGEAPLKYFYLHMDFFQKLGGLKYENLTISKDLRGKLNKKGEEYFNKYDAPANLAFNVSGSETRAQSKISGIKSLFDGAKVSSPTRHHDYLTEFAYYEVLAAANAEEDLVAKQKSNFLITILSYVLEEEKERLLSEEVRRLYKQYKSTTNGKLTLDKLYDLDQITKENPNEPLKKRIESLYVLQVIETKIHFVFSFEQSLDNEEIREVLSIMQDSGSSSNRELLYRGQACSHWRLDSSLTREKKFLERERDLYYDILSLKPDAFSNDSSVYERLITMQHYGMPTRLMDLSRNPLVAIFFACNNLAMAGDDGAIFVFTPESKCVLNFESPKLEKLKELYTDGDTESKSLDSLTYIRGVAKNQRISNQSGDFLFVGKEVKPKDIEGEVADLVIIDAAVKAPLLELLEKLNVHGGAVYPDLSHMSNYIKAKYMKA